MGAIDPHHIGAATGDFEHVARILRRLGRQRH
jgi:hypothetical protein